MPPKKKAEPTIEGSTVASLALRNKYGDIVRKNEVAPVSQETCLPTPSISLDILTNEAGIRPGVITEWYGMPGVTKTRTALQLCSRAQLWAPDKSVAYIDVEGDVDLFAAETSIGVDTQGTVNGINRFVYWPDSQYDSIPNLDDIMERVEDYAASGLFSVIVIDSIAACISAWQQKADSPTDAKAFGAASDIQAAFRRIKPACQRTGTRVWIINQLYTTTIRGPQGPMPKDISKGGLAIKYAASNRFKTSWRQTSKEDDEYAMLRVVAEKIKYGKSDREVEIPVMGGLIDAEADLIGQAAKYGIIVKKGAWYAYDGSNIGNGLYQSANNLRKFPELVAKIRKETLETACPQATESFIPSGEAAPEE